MDDMTRNIVITCSIVAAVIVILLLLYFFIFSKKRKAKKDNALLEKIFMALGGKENILELSVTGSRLSFKLQDNDKLQKEELKNLGVPSIIFMSNKTTIVIGKDLAQDIYKAYNKK